jgi:prefoldin subunit 5
MAIFHLHLQIISRGKGKSAVGKAAYRSGETLHNEYDGVTHDYTKKGGIVHTEILLPPNAPAEYASRSTLWNAVEKSERYKTAQLARELEIALPVELSREQQISLVRRYVKETFVSAGMCADICVHDTGKGNPHAHIMLTMRPLEKDGTWGQKSHTVNGRKINTVDWNDRDKAEEWRRAWAAYANSALHIAGVQTEDNVLDHRSYERQGIEQKPTVHLGPYASSLEKCGVHTELGDKNREIAELNSKLRQANARIKKLKTWLDELNSDTTPTLLEILLNVTSGDPNRSNYAKNIDTKLASKMLVFFQNNGIETIADLRGKVADYYDERKDMNDKLQPFKRCIKTLDEHLRHSDNFTKHIKIAKQRDALSTEAYALEKQGFFSKGKAQKAREKSEAYAWKHRNALVDYDAAEKYLRGILQKRFDPKTIPAAKWRQERETLAQELGGLTTEHEVLNDRIRDVELIRKSAEEVQRAMNPVVKKREMGLEI